jgi:hypothetical protein
MVRVRSPFFGDWWNDKCTWRNSPMRDIVAWIGEDRESA